MRTKRTEQLFDFHLASRIIRSLPKKKTNLSYIPGLAMPKMSEYALPDE